MAVCERARCGCLGVVEVGPATPEPEPAGDATGDQPTGSVLRANVVLRRTFGIGETALARGSWLFLERSM